MTIDEIDRAGDGINVAVIDTGVWYYGIWPYNPTYHSDLVDNLDQERHTCFQDIGNGLYQEIDPVSDYMGHGTHMAGIIAAMDNDFGVIGVAPKVNLFIIQMLRGTQLECAAAINRSVYWGADIISISWEWRSDPDNYLKKACDYAYYDMQTLIFSISGNNKTHGGQEVIRYPACYDSVIAVGAVDTDDSWAWFSNYGNELYFVAPGVNINSTYLNNGYYSDDGTSMACAHVAATAALIASSKKEAEYGNVWNTTTIIRKLRDTVLNLGDDEGWDEKYGYGLVNAWRANQRPTGDIKWSDNYVNAEDAIILGRAWGTSSSNPNEHTRNADINIDNYVNAKDAVLLGTHFGESMAEERKDGGSKEDQYSSKLKVQPESNVFYTDTANIGDNFTINIIADNVTDLYGWEFKLTWTPGLINCTTETLNENLWTDYSNPWIGTPIDNENGTYHQCLTARSLVPSFNGSTWLVNLAFQITQAPPEGGILSTDINLSATSGLTYSLLNSSALEIPHNFIHGSYSYVSPRYMRSDTHTINGLLAYKLNSSQSASYLQTSITDTESNTVYWGIRVWKRSSAGAETEITSGTPVAQVSRSLSGYGIQSATWNCPNTTLTPTDSIVVRVYCKNGGNWTLQVSKCKKCGKIIAEPKELIRIAKSSSP